MLIEKIQFCINKSQAEIKKNKKNPTLPRKNWITIGITTSCRTKEKLYKIWKNDPNNEEKKENYKKYAKSLQKIINQAKLNYDKKLIEQNASNQRNLWNVIKDKLGKNTKKNSKISYILENNNKITDTTEIAESMNNYFCDIGEKLRDKITQPHNATRTLPPNNNNTIYLKPTNQNEVKEIISNMKNKNGGVDGINSNTLKTINNKICSPLANIFNNCLDKEIWPDALKTAEVIPLHKANEKHLQNNYRPISLISNLAKIFEKLIHKRFTDFFNKHNIISNRQYGFRKNMGTKNALEQITNLLYNNLDKSDPTAIAFLDLAKAFDTVDHQILLDKLYRYGIRGKAYNIIKSYLSNRQQRVKINNKFSNFKTVNTGVPQGTILGPLLFIIYINDMLFSIPEESILSYADDTAILITGKNWQEIENKMNQLLHTIAIWLALNKLSLNTDKTIYMEFGNTCNSTPKNLNISIQGKRIQRVENTKYLGVIFDSNLKWEKHIDNIYNKKKYLIFVFYKLSKIMSTQILLMLYHAFFHSVISYGIIAWGGAYKGRIRSLQGLQTRLLKIISKNSFLTDKYPMSIEQSFQYESLSYHYNELQSLYLESNSITRNKSIQLPKRYKKVSIKNSYIRAISAFNNLPNELKTLSSKFSIKTKLKKWIKDTY